MKINVHDYRLLFFENQNQKDEELNDLRGAIEKKHSINNWYAYLNNKANDADRKSFAKIFNDRCCYCGASFLFALNCLNIEIDHIFSKSVKPNSAEEINDLENLASSCHNCNSKKKAIVVNSYEANIINPYHNITKVFSRTSDLYIEIRDEYKTNTFVLDFYNKLGLKKEIHRLFYICLVLNDLKKKNTANDYLYSRLSKAVDSINRAINNSLRA